MNRAEAFIEAYKRTGSVKRAAEAAKINRTTHYARLKADPKYREAFLAADEEATQVLEDECVRRALEGTQEPVYWQGEECGYKLNYSDSNLQFLLRGRRPEKYRERYKHEHSGQVNLKFAGGMEQLLALYHDLTTNDDSQET